jgi:hypothetical protein
MLVEFAEVLLVLVEGSEQPEGVLGEGHGASMLLRSPDSVESKYGIDLRVDMRNGGGVEDLSSSAARGGAAISSRAWRKGR